MATVEEARASFLARAKEIRQRCHAEMTAAIAAVMVGAAPDARQRALDEALRRLDSALDLELARGLRMLAAVAEGTYVPSCDAIH